MQGSVDSYRPLNRKFNRKSKNQFRLASQGFTLMEIMIVTVIVAIGVALVAPSFKPAIQKRQLVSAAEQVVSFMEYAQGEAIKRNEKVTVSWYSPGSHNVNWCIGASLPPKTAPCDCMETVATEDDFCSIDSVPYRLVQSDFTEITNEFIHMNPRDSSIAFDPVRGIVTDIAHAESVDGDWLFYIHSDMKIDNVRLYELEISLHATGRTSICADDGRKSLIGGYPVC